MMQVSFKFAAIVNISQSGAFTNIINMKYVIFLNLRKNFISNISLKYHQKK